MKTLSRNKNNDIYIQAGGLAMSTGAEAKCDIIESLILTQQGELQFDEDAGIDYFGTVFQNQEYIELWADQVRTKVLDLDWVSSVEDFTYRYDVVTSSIIWSMTVITTDGETLNPSSKKKKSDDVMKYEVKWDTIYNKEHVDEALASMQGMSKASNSKYPNGLSSSATLMDTKKAINDILLTPNGAPDTDDSDDIRFVINIASGNTVVKTGDVTASGEWSIDWGDGVRESYEDGDTISAHTYANEGTYLIVISGNVSVLNVGSTGNPFLYTEGANGSVSITGFSAGKYSFLTELGDYAFYGCSGMNAVVVSSPLTTIGENCFYGTGITTLDWMPQTVTSIGSGCFYDCSYLRSIKGLSKSITIIPQESFKGCSRIESLVYIPQGVTEIGANAFDGCSNAKDAFIPASCETLGNYAFKNCSNLVNIRSDLFEVDAVTGLFEGRKQDAYLYVPSNKTSTYKDVWGWSEEYIKEWGEITFNTTGIESGIKVFSAKGAFKSDCAMLVRYGDESYAVLRNTETTIPEHEYSQSVSSIEISGYVTALSGINNKSYPCLAFDKLCNGDYISAVNAGSMPSLTTIGAYSFFTCTNLTSVILPASVTEIGSYAFAETNSLNSISADGVTTIGAHCFESCGLSAIPSFVSNMTSLPAYCFAYCGGIEAFANANVANIVSFGAYCFTETGLISLAGIGAGLTSLGVGCFAKCVALENISALSTCAVTELSDDCFNGCNNASFTSLDGTQNITAVGARCFQGTKIQTLQYLNAVETIGDDAFRDTPLSGTDYLPSSLKSLGNYCFANTAISEVNFYVANPPSITENTFGLVGIAESLPIYVLPDSLELYQSAPIWSGLGVKTRGIKFTIGGGEINLKGVVDGSGLRYVSYRGDVTIAAFSVDAEYDSMVDGDEIVIAGNITRIKGYISSGWLVKEISIAWGTEIESIGAYAFRNLGLTKATLSFAENGDIGNKAFIDCSNLTSIDLGGEYGPTKIGARAFAGCTSLNSITGAEKVTTIGDSAFEGCSALTTLEGFPSIGSIGKNAFKDCSALNRVILTTETVPAVGEDAFSGIHSSAYLQVPAKVIAAYNGWGGFTRIYPLGIAFKMSVPEGGLTLAANTALVESAEGFEVDWGDGSTTEFSSGQQLLPLHAYMSGGDYYIELLGDDIIKISANLVGLPMFTTGEKGDSTYLKTVIVPPTTELQKIGDYTFYKCTELSTADISGEKDLSIGQYAFAGCSALSTFNVGVNNQAVISALATAAFKDCTSLTELPSAKVSYIGQSAFEGCTLLEDATGFYGVVSIGSRAFYGCANLVSMPSLWNPPHVIENASELAEAACVPNANDFNEIIVALQNQGYSSITENSTVQDAVDVVSNSPREVVDSENAEDVTIGDYAFYGCTRLSNIGSLSTVISIGDYGFYGCQSLANNALEGFTSLETIGAYAFVGCNAVSSLTGLGKLQTIGDYAFQNCIALTSISPLIKLTSIGSGAFSGCTGIRAVVCQSPDIVSIGDLAFAGCGVTKISMSAVTPPMIGQNTFFGVDKSIIPVNVPQTGIAKYRNAQLWNEMPINYWSEFANISSSQSIRFYLSGIPASGIAISGRTADITVEPVTIYESVYDSNTGNTITVSTQYREWTVDWGDGSRVETYDVEVTSLPRHVYTGDYSSAVITISGNIKGISAVGEESCPILSAEGESEFPYLTKVEVDASLVGEEEDEGLTSIGDYCFYNSTNLRHFKFEGYEENVFPESVQIADTAFLNTPLGPEENEDE